MSYAPPMKKILYVDDIRNPPDIQGVSWDIARSFLDAIEKLSNIDYDGVSLDHDIASYDENGREMTGYDIALWLAERKYNNKYVPQNIQVHSANPVGRERIEGVIKRYLTNA